MENGTGYFERAVGMRNANALTSAAGVQYNTDEGKSDQYGTMWTLEANVLDNNEVASFYNLIGEKEHGKGILQNSNGEFIFDVSDKLVYSNGDYLNPRIAKVVSFNTTDADTIELAKEIILNEEYYGSGSEVLYNEIVEAVLGEGIITTTNFEADRRKGNHFGKGSGGGKIDSGSRKNASYSIENLTPEQVEAIKKAEESGDKVSEFYKNSLQKEVITPAVKAEDAPERHKYKPISNEETYKNARAYVEATGFDKAKAV